MLVQKVIAYSDGNVTVVLNWSGKKVHTKVDMGGHGYDENDENPQSNGGSQGSILGQSAPPDGKFSSVKAGLFISLHQIKLLNSSLSVHFIKDVVHF